MSTETATRRRPEPPERPSGERHRAHPSRSADAVTAGRRRLDPADRQARGLPPVSRPTWWQRLDASDPGAVRLALSVRAVGNLAVILVVENALTMILGLGGTPRTVVLILGCVLAMITTFTATDATPGGRLITQVSLPVAMIATITLSMLVDHHRVLSLATFVVVMFVVVWIRRFGPRAFACGMVAWIGYFITLFLQLSLAQLPLAAISIGAATVVLVVLSAAVAPMRPHRRMRRMVDALTARVQIARWDAGRGRHATGADEHALSTALLRANETAVLVDGQLAVPGAVRDPAAAPQVRAAVLRVELALAALLDAEVANGPGIVPADRELDAALDRLATVVDASGRRATRPANALGAPPTPDSSTGPATTGTAPTGIGEFTPGAMLFAGFLPGSAATVGAMFDPPADAERSTPRSRGWWGRLTLTTRQALQIAVASTLTIILADVVSGQRWYWAILACFLAFTGTATAAETARKAAQRTVGTVVGVVIALPLLPLLGSGVTVGLITMLLALFVGFYFFRVSYTVLALSVTILVAELYELMGAFSEGLLWLRVTETVLGAVIGSVVAISVLPTPAHDAESAARAQLAEDLRDALVDVVTVVRGGRARAHLHERLRVLDGGIHQLAVIGVAMHRREIPGTAGPRAAVRRRLAAWVHAAMRVRAVVHAIEDAPGQQVPGHPEVARAIASVHDLAEGLVLDRGPSGVDDLDRDAEPAASVVVPSPAGADPSPAGEPRDDPDLLRELSALDGALVALHEIDGSTGNAAGEPDRADARGRPGARTQRPALPAPDPRTASPCLRGATRARDGSRPEVVVTLVDANGQQRGRTRAIDGRYELVLPGPGTWQVVAGAPGHTPRADRVVVGAHAREIVHDITLDAAPVRGRGPGGRHESVAAQCSGVPLAGF